MIRRGSAIGRNSVIGRLVKRIHTDRNLMLLLSHALQDGPSIPLNGLPERGRRIWRIEQCLREKTLILGGKPMISPCSRSLRGVDLVALIAISQAE